MEVNSKVRYVSLFVCVLMFNATIGEIYYAGTQRSTFYDANATCHDLGGQVLRYGMVFIDALVKCHQYIYAWTGLPFYEQLPGCYRGSATMTTSPDQRQENKRVAICADFCSDANFTHFGVMTTECHCYAQEDFGKLEFSDSCQIPLCPGNIFDICGMFPQAIVFRKVPEVEGFGSCHARSVYADGKSHRYTGYCFDHAPFLCKVGDSNEVSCSLPQSTTKSEYQHTEAITTDYTNLETTVTQTMGETTERGTFTSEITDGKSEQSNNAGTVLGISDSGNNNGMITGIVISGVLLVIIIAVLVVLFKCRKKKAFKDKEDKQIPPVIYFTNDVIPDVSDTDVSYNSVQFNATVRETAKDTEPERDDRENMAVKKFKPWNQMCDQEFLFYDPAVFSEN